MGDPKVHTAAPDAPRTPAAFDLGGRVAIVTGASRGIGRAIAGGLASAGASVVVVGRKPDGVERAAAEIEAEGGRALAVAANVGDAGALDAVAAAAVERFGGIDIVVNNAGTCPHFGPLVTADDAVWDKTLAVNARAALHAVRASLPSMRARGGGKVVNVASVAALMPQPSVGLYCISKAALVMLTEVLAVELAADHVQVNAVAPGFVETRFSRAIVDDPRASAGALALIPQRRFAAPEEIVGAVLYLCSPASSFTTGATLVVDGGQRLAGGLPLPGA